MNNKTNKTKETFTFFKLGHGSFEVTYCNRVVHLFNIAGFGDPQWCWAVKGTSFESGKGVWFNSRETAFTDARDFIKTLPPVIVVPAPVYNKMEQNLYKELYKLELGPDFCKEIAAVLCKMYPHKNNMAWETRILKDRLALVANAIQSAIKP